MSDPLVWAEGYHSPASILLSSKIPTSVFYSHPNDASDPDPSIYPPPSGWGSPFVNEDGVKLPVGTKEGPGQTKKISKIDNNWSMQARPGGQVYGNIDWRGPVVHTAENGEEIRIRLTWNGPQMRYFPDDRYDFTDDKAYELYYKGKIIAVTPKSILGAAARKEVDPNTVSTDLVWMLYIICKDGLGDTLYKYRMDVNGGWDRNTLTSDIRSGLTSYYTSYNLIGYETVYSLPRQSQHGTPGHEIDDEALEARTPWFFNESCTKLVCMREIETTYTDDNNTEYTENSLSKYILDIENSPLFLYGGNLPRMKWHETHDFNRYLNANDSDAEIWNLYPYDRQNPTYDITVLHPYIRFKVEQVITSSGDQTVATDFDGDFMVTASIKFSNYRSQRQEFSQGVDCNTDYGLWDSSCDTNLQNFNEPCGRQPGTGFEFLNGDGAARISGNNGYLLKFENTVGRHEFTIVWDVYGDTDALSGGGVNPGEPSIVDFHGYTKRFMHFMDLRHPYTMVYSEILAEQWLKSDQVTTQVFHKEAYSINSNEAEYISSVTIKDEVVAGSALGYVWAAGDIDTKPIIGGPDWVFSKDIIYNHSTDSGVTYDFRTEFVNSGWREGLDTRSLDELDIDPPYVDFWTMDGTLPPNKWESWSVFFGNSYYDAILESDLYMNQVVGSMAKSEEDWIFSYKEFDPLTGDPTTEIHNLINGKDAVKEIEIVVDFESGKEVEGVNVEIEALYPLGVI